MRPWNWGKSFRRYATAQIAWAHLYSGVALRGLRRLDEGAASIFRTGNGFKADSV
ncbi:hypothetical protein [Microtetraspora fusca]|uniref:hypothetical protein n=1 Tax=Microtetraspora fusca TaxID=1997 RepID=UPI000A6ECC4C|nr:hypothetical protein [Microtetraspora fusca]